MFSPYSCVLRLQYKHLHGCLWKRTVDDKARMIHSNLAYRNHRLVGVHTIHIYESGCTASMIPFQCAAALHHFPISCALRFGVLWLVVSTLKYTCVSQYAPMNVPCCFPSGTATKYSYSCDQAVNSLRRTGCACTSGHTRSL